MHDMIVLGIGLVVGLLMGIAAPGSLLWCTKQPDRLVDFWAFQYLKARDWVLNADEGFDNDPPDTPYQRGYQAAVKDMISDVFHVRPNQRNGVLPR